MFISVQIYSFKILIQKLSTAHHLKFECFNAWKHVIEDIVTDSKSFRCWCRFQFIWFKTNFDFLPFNFPFDNNELGPSEMLNICAAIDACCFDSFFFFPLSVSFFNYEEYYCARHVMIYFICQLYLTCFHLNSLHWTSTLSFVNIFCPFVRSVNWKS